VRAAGIRWRDYDRFMQKYVKRVGDERLTKLPADLDLKPYRDEHEHCHLSLPVPFLQPGAGSPLLKKRRPPYRLDCRHRASSRKDSGKDEVAERKRETRAKTSDCRKCKQLRQGSFHARLLCSHRAFSARPI
jgi:hypothetical protein